MGISRWASMALMAEAMIAAGPSLLKSGGGHTRVGLTPKQWQKRKRRLKMRSYSRKVNR